MYFYVIGLLNNQTKDMWGNVLPQPWWQSMPLPPASDRYALHECMPTFLLATCN